MRRVELTPGWWRREGHRCCWDRHSGDISAAVWRRGRYHIWEPATGLATVIDDSSASRWGRDAILLEPLLDPNRPARIRDLLRLGARGSNHSLWLVAGLTAVVGILAAVIPIVAGQLTATVADQTRSTLAIVGVALVAFAAGVWRFAPCALCSASDSGPRDGGRRNRCLGSTHQAADVVAEQSNGCPRG